MNWLGMAFTVALIATQSHFSTHPLAPFDVKGPTVTRYVHRLPGSQP